MKLQELPDDVLDLIYEYKHRLEMRPVLVELFIYHHSTIIDTAILRLIKSLMHMEMRRQFVNREIIELYNI